jgi:hypothetical protein
MIIDTSSNNPEQLPSFATGVIIKQTQGMTYVNPFVYSQINQAKAMGIPYATYHYLTGLSAEEISRAVAFFQTLDGPEFLMLDFSRLVNLNAVAYIPQPEGVNLTAYCNQAQRAQVAYSGLKIGLAYWQGEAAAADYLATQSDLFGIQWTDNYNGYDAWTLAPGYLSSSAVPTPAAEAVATQVGPVDTQVTAIASELAKVDSELATIQQEEDMISVTDYTHSTGPNGEGWIKIPQTTQVVSVVALTSSDPSTGTAELTHYPTFVVTPLNGFQVISWSGGRPNSQLTFRVASI